MKTRKFLALLLTCMIASSALAALQQRKHRLVFRTESSAGRFFRSGKQRRRKRQHIRRAHLGCRQRGNEPADLPADRRDGDADLLVSQRRQHGGTGDFNDSYFFKWYEELTNVHIDFIVPAAGSEGEAFQLLFASDSMPDMVYSYPNQTTYSYRLVRTKRLRTGTLLTSRNTWTMRQTTSRGWPTTTTSAKRLIRTRGNSTACGASGRAWTRNTPMPTMALLSARTSSTSRNGVPTTYSEWEAVLTAFKR